MRGFFIYSILMSSFALVHGGSSFSFAGEPIVIRDAEYASDLASKGRVQEAIWIYHSLNQPKKVEKLKQSLNETFAGEYTIEQKRLGGFNAKGQIIGIAKPMTILHFQNGISAIFKEKRPNRDNMEVAAYRLDQLLDLNMTPFTKEFTLKETGKFGSLQYYVKDMQPGGNTNSVHYAEMRLFDYLIGNFDRFEGNWLSWPGEQRIIGIDHEFAFSQGKMGGFVGKEGELYLGSGICRSQEEILSNSELLTLHIERALRFSPDLMSDQFKKRLLNVTPIEIEEILRPFLPAERLQEVITRMNHIKALLKDEL